ncbi:hypothetical protein [Pseudomonas abieticivorans]|uniref:hypothetical protein n=1 Tax=Pseudomonas abieticivorans TaxID=2931382 RepID=UPI0020C10FE9|nr:hypothetical protein [Pseudomonas sp. PIA16]
MTVLLFWLGALGLFGLASDLGKRLGLAATLLPALAGLNPTPLNTAHAARRPHAKH